MNDEDKPILLFTNLNNAVYSFFYPPIDGNDSVILLTIDLDFMVYVNLKKNTIGTVGGNFEVGEKEAIFIDRIWKTHVVSH